MTEAIVRRRLYCIVVDRRGLHESGRPASAASPGWIVSVDRSASGHRCGSPPGEPTLSMTTLVRPPCALLAEALQRRTQAAESGRPGSARLS